MISDKGASGRTAWLLIGYKRSAERAADGMNDDKRCAGRTAYGNVPCGMKRWAADDGNEKSQREVKPITKTIRRYGN